MNVRDIVSNHLGFTDIPVKVSKDAIVWEDRLPRSLVPVSAVIGALFMVWVDTVSRVLFAPSALPIGVGTALVGVPVFIAILVKKRR